MRRIAIVTATRAEYGLLTPLIERICRDSELELDLIVTGTHLSEEYGYTIDDIRGSGLQITHEIPILEKGNTAYAISLTMANAIKGFASCFRDDRPDIVIILGDRTEMLGVAVAAMNERIPIAHIHGGEVTEGAVDDCIRHALSKMSYLHFTSTEMYRKRVVQMGEDPKRVFNVGALGIENILHQELLDKEQIREELGIAKGFAYAVVTYHPVTLKENSEEDVKELCIAMESTKNIFFLITAANADVGGEKINQLFIKFSREHLNARFTCNLGMKRYLSAIKYSAFVLGNSSSGIFEAPVLGVPTVNVGERQKGRIAGNTVVHCKPDQRSIKMAIQQVLSVEFQKKIKGVDNIYGDGFTSKKIIKVIKEYLIENKIDIKKGFLDLNIEI